METDNLRKKSAIEKEKCRKRKQTETEKIKSRERKASKDLDVSRVTVFKNAIKEGPYYICVVCHRCLYKKSVKKFISNQYNVSCDVFHEIQSFDQCKYICITCDKHLKKNNTPPQAVSKLMFDPIPDILKDMNCLEKTLIAKRILFKKMPKGQQPKIRGSVHNIPVQADAVSNVLPRPADNDGVVLVKL